MDAGEFFTAGLADRHSYYIKGDVVGVTNGASECCDNTPAYNEIVPLVNVSSWNQTSFRPSKFVSEKHFYFILILLCLILFDVIVLLLYMILRVIKLIAQRKSKAN